jgi:hypothetical protein
MFFDEWFLAQRETAISRKISVCKINTVRTPKLA